MDELLAKAEERFTPFAITCDCKGSDPECQVALDDPAVWAQYNTVKRMVEYLAVEGQKMRESEIDPEMLRSMSLSVSDCGKQVLALQDAIQRVRDIHSEVIGFEAPFCGWCLDSYPCTTITALDGEQ